MPVLKFLCGMNGYVELWLNLNVRYMLSFIYKPKFMLISEEYGFDLLWCQPAVSAITLNFVGNFTSMKQNYICWQKINFNKGERPLEEESHNSFNYGKHNEQ